MNPFKFQGAVYQSDLPTSAKILILAIGYHYNYINNSAAFPSIELLQKETGLSRATIHRMKKLLIENGWLKQSRKYNKSNRYLIMIPDSLTMIPRLSHNEELTMKLTLNRTLNNKSSNEDLLDNSNTKEKPKEIITINESDQSSLTSFKAMADLEWR